MTVRVALLTFALFALAGCPDLSPSGVPTTCEKQFEKCKLPSGPLGVCQQIECPPGAKPPCLKCVSQH